MEQHLSSAELKGFATVIRPQKLSKKELLERWALALEKRKGVRLCILRETEYKPVKERSALQQENSPLTVALEDPQEKDGWLMQRGCPRVHGEFMELIDQIVLSSGTNLTNGESFLAGSSFTLWGALFLNPAVSRTVLSLLETLAHEAAHSLLFGIQISGPLVLNPDDELFASPLRIDLRPMDGVYHATFVSARMHFAIRELLASGLLNGEDIANAHQAAARDRHHFFEGLETVRKHGQLTPAGESVMSGAETYMARTA